MRLCLFLIVGISAGLSSPPAHSQTHLGSDTARGLHWAVSAPSRTHWRLACGFRPITRAVNPYEQKRWANRLNHNGEGSGRGRLPGDNGSCTLTRLSGQGALGFAIVKDGKARALGMADTERSVTVNVF